MLEKVYGLDDPLIAAIKQAVLEGIPLNAVSREEAGAAA